MDSEHLQLVSRLGRAQGVSSLLRATPRLAPRRICHLPADLVARHGVQPERLWRGLDDPATREVAFEVASAANRHLQHVRQWWSGEGAGTPHCKYGYVRLKPELRHNHVCLY